MPGHFQSVRWATGLALGAALMSIGCAGNSGLSEERHETGREQRGGEEPRGEERGRGEEREREGESGHAYAGYMANLDFEAGDEQEGDEYEPAVAWKGGGPQCDFRLDTEITHSGAYAARLHREADGLGPPNNYGVVTQWADASHFLGKRLVYSAWVRTRDVRDGFVAIFVRVDGPGLRPLVFQSTDASPIRGTTEWTRYELAVDFPQGAVGFRFGLVLTGSGTAWYDDVKFERVEQAPGR